MGGLRSLFGIAPTIGDMIAQSLREEHDDWVDDYGTLLNKKRGLRVHVLRFMSKERVEAGVPLTMREKVVIRRAYWAWFAAHQESARHTAELRFLQGVPING